MKILGTDGSASPNPGPGGFAVIYDGKPVKLGREDDSTNIRMEGAAMRAALEFLDGEEGEIHSDSEFWINVLTKWAPVWQKNGWVKKTGPIKNLNLVKELYKLYSESLVKLIWVKGHDGIEMNELTDFWANRARQNEGTEEVKVELVSTV